MVVLKRACAFPFLGKRTPHEWVSRRKPTTPGNRLVISGEKKEETKKDEKDWHVEERSYGSFYRSMSLPFKPEDGAVEAHFDKGVLHLNIKKPSEVAKSAKTIEIKPG
jgi:HSP20 family protein